MIQMIDVVFKIFMDAASDFKINTLVHVMEEGSEDTVKENYEMDCAAVLQWTYLYVRTFSGVCDTEDESKK